MNEILNQSVVYLFTLLVLGLGMYMTIKLEFVQIKYFKRGWQKLFSNTTSDQGISSYRAAALAIGGRLGTGNVAGVALAIYIGGFGAIFWLWVSAFLAMAISCAETTIAQLYKSYDNYGNFMGGPMTYIERGLGSKYRLLAYVYGFIMLFTVGFTYIIIHTEIITQSLLSFAGVESNFQLELITAILIVVVCTYILLGGTKKVARYAATIVPVMMLSYIVLVLVIAVTHINYVPKFFITVISSAFEPNAALGGGLGGVIITGVTLSTFSNEAGQGIATLAGGLADTKHPLEQGLVNMITIFIDSIVVCTMTAFVIMLALDEYGPLIDIHNTSDIAMHSFSMLYEGGEIILLLFILVFTFMAITTSVTYGIQEIKNMTQNKTYRVYANISRGYVTLVMIPILLSPILIINNQFAFNLIIKLVIIMIVINLFTIFKLRKVIVAIFKHYQAGNKTFKTKDIGLDDEHTIWK